MMKTGIRRWWLEWVWLWWDFKLSNDYERRFAQCRGLAQEVELRKNYRHWRGEMLDEWIEMWDDA